MVFVEIELVVNVLVVVVFIIKKLSGGVVWIVMRGLYNDYMVGINGDFI